MEFDLLFAHLWRLINQQVNDNIAQRSLQEYTHGECPARINSAFSSNQKKKSRIKKNIRNSSRAGVVVEVQLRH